MFDASTSPGNKIDDIAFPVDSARSAASLTFPPLDPAIRSSVYLSPFLLYQFGFLVCQPKVNRCAYHKFGSAGWTEPAEYQPGYADATNFVNPIVLGGGTKFWMVGGENLVTG